MKKRRNVRPLSVPASLQEKINVYPPESFSTLPVVNLPDYDWWDDQWPLAPAASSIRTHDRPSHTIVEWTVVRCPFCGDKHTHLDTVDRHPSQAISVSSTRLGAHSAKCEKFRPMMSPVSDTWGINAKYFIVGLDRVPSTDEIERYFPMATNFFNGDGPLPPAGGVYLIKSGDSYKIGVSVNPESRIRSIQTANPNPIEVIHIEYTNDFRSREAALHRQFRDHRTIGEWFAFPKNMITDVLIAMEATS